MLKISVKAIKRSGGSVSKYMCAFQNHAKVVASNQYALPVLTYLMWTQTWPIANIQQIDQVGRKIVVENGGNHPKGSTAILYMSVRLGSSVEEVSSPWRMNTRALRSKQQ